MINSGVIRNITKDCFNFDIALIENYNNMKTLIRLTSVSTLLLFNLNIQAQCGLWSANQSGIVHTCRDVGIGTSTPQKKLHVKSVHPFEATPGGSLRLEDIFLDGVNTVIGNSVWDFSPIRGVNNPPMLRILSPQVNEQVAIGDKTQFFGLHNNFTLSVYGKVVARKYIATELNWADDEFARDLTFDDLDNEEKFVKKNSHLTGIPAADKLEKDGIDLAEMSSFHMRKIEQVFLYLFKFNAVIKQLKNKMKENVTANKKLRKENKYLKNELADLKKRVEALEHKTR